MGRPISREKCEMLGCEFMQNARGMCRTHYGQWLRANNGKATEAIPRNYQSIDTEDFWQFVKKELQLG